MSHFTGITCVATAYAGVHVSEIWTGNETQTLYTDSGNISLRGAFDVSRVGDESTECLGKVRHV